jgi:hypothetical protein
LAKKIYTALPSTTFLFGKVLYNPGKTGTFLHFKGFSSIKVIHRFSLCFQIEIGGKVFCGKFGNGGVGPLFSLQFQPYPLPFLGGLNLFKRDSRGVCGFLVG